MVRRGYQILEKNGNEEGGTVVRLKEEERQLLPSRPLEKIFLDDPKVAPMYKLIGQRLKTARRRYRKMKWPLNRAAIFLPKIFRECLDQFPNVFLKGTDFLPAEARQTRMNLSRP